MKLDFSSLSQPLSHKEIAPFSPSRNWLVAGIILGVFTVVLLVTGKSITTANEMPLGFIFFGLLLPALPFLIYALGRMRAKQLARMKRFAEQNQVGFFVDVNDPLYEGMIFDEGYSRKILEAYAHEGIWEIGNYEYVTGSGKNRSTHHYGYVKMQLPRKLPHIVLDAKANNLFGKLTNLPELFNADQKLSLEGDFNTYFTLYAPKAYERDILYVLTPDIMQLLIEGRQYDVEIVDDTLYLYKTGKHNLLSTPELQALFQLLERFRAKFEMRTDYYADERIGDRSLNVISQAGQRLKKRNMTLVIVLFIISWIVLSELDVFVRIFMTLIGR